MAALPYIQLYVADYLADTAHLTAIEHGVYLLLIMNYWQRSKPLPNDDLKLAQIGRCKKEEWLKMKNTILDFFKVDEKFVIHPRIENDLKKIKLISKKRAIAGKAGSSARWSDSNCHTLAKQLPIYKDNNKNIVDVIVVPERDLPAQKTDRKNAQFLDDVSLGDYRVALSKHFPHISKTSKKGSRTHDMFLDWSMRGVTQEDVAKGLKLSLSKGDNVYAPTYLNAVVIAHTESRIKNKPLSLYKKRENFVKPITQIIEENIQNGK